MVRLTIIPAVAALVLLTAPVAGAAPVDDAARELETASVWVDPAARRQVDVAAVTKAIGTSPIKIAILPSGPTVSEVSVLPRQLAGGLPGQTIAVIAGRYFYAGSEVLCDGEAGKAASAAINANNAALDAGDNSDLTKALTDFVVAVKAAPTCSGPVDRGDRYGAAPAVTGAAGVDDTASVLPWVLTGAGVLAAGLAGWVLVSRRRARSGSVAQREQTRALVDQLGQQVADLPESAAADKHGEAQALLLGATTDEQFAAVRQVAEDGLAAVRAAAAKSDAS